MLVLGPLSRHPEPFTYDLCHDHADKLTAPQGWQVVRLYTRYDDVTLNPSDPEALLNALKQPYEAAEDRLAVDESQQRHPSGKAAELDAAQGAQEPASSHCEHSAQIIELPLRAQGGKASAGRRTPAPLNEATKNVEYGPFTPRSE